MNAGVVVMRVEEVRVMFGLWVVEGFPSGELIVAHGVRMWDMVGAAVANLYKRGWPWI